MLVKDRIIPYGHEKKLARFSCLSMPLVIFLDKPVQNKVVSKLISPS
jgi:hypothetical protein